MMKAAFVYVTPEVSPETHTAELVSEGLTLTVVGCVDYAQAEQVAKDLVAKGINAIELCAGFGNEGVARVTKAVEGKVPVGVVRFDRHPGLGFKSGDELF